MALLPCTVFLPAGHGANQVNDPYPATIIFNPPTDNSQPVTLEDLLNANCAAVVVRQELGPERRVHAKESCNA